MLDYFQLLKKNNRLGSSYLFIGNNFDWVMQVVKTISCSQAQGFCGDCWDCGQLDQQSHPDLFIASPDPTTIRIEKIREAQKFLSLRPYKSGLKILLIKDAESLGLEAANAFLKTLEEPPKNSFIGLCASKQEGLLATIVSRCRKIYLPWVETSPDRKSMEEAVLFLKGEKIKFNDRAKFSLFLWTLIVLVRGQIQKNLGRQDNQLIIDNPCEIILAGYPLNQLIKVLETLLKVYSCAGNTNENLALNMVRAQF